MSAPGIEAMMDRRRSSRVCRATAMLACTITHSARLRALRDSLGGVAGLLAHLLSRQACALHLITCLWSAERVASLNAARRRMKIVGFGIVFACCLLGMS